MTTKVSLAVQSTGKILDTKALIDELSPHYGELIDIMGEVNNGNFGEKLPIIRNMICELEGKFANVDENVKSVLSLTRKYLNDVKDDVFPHIYGEAIKLKSAIDSTPIYDGPDAKLYLNEEECIVIYISTITPSTLFGDMLDRIVSINDGLVEHSNATTNKFMELLTRHASYPNVDFREDFTIENVYGKIKSWELLLQTYPQIMEIMHKMLHDTENNIKVYYECIFNIKEKPVEL